MRLHIKFDSDNSQVPINHLKKLVGTVHKWLGPNNEEHGQVSLYSFSWLRGGKLSASKQSLDFSAGGSLFISAWDREFISKHVNGIMENPDMFCGLKVRELTLQDNPDFSNIERFEAAAPVFVRNKVEDKAVHYLYSQPETSELLRETLLTKMAIAGLSDDSLEISFDKRYPKATTKLVHYGEIKNRANICPVIIKGLPETKAFAWNVGIGHSTGIGFGALR
jgi:CRISPR-associated endoribonuclease Cas6